MIRVDAMPGSPRLAKVTPLAYWDVYNKNLRSIPGAKLQREERPGLKDLWYWTLPVSSLDELDNTFSDDFISVNYMTPKWRLMGHQSPPLPTYMTRISARDPANFKLPLLPYQSYGASFMVDAAQENLASRGRGYMFLCDDMGLGKSAQALGAVELLIEDGQISRDPGEDMILILGLSVAKIQWIRDAVHKFTQHQGLAIRSLPVKAREKLWQTWSQYKYISVNYELLMQPMDAQFLFSLPWKAIILDEPHQKLMGWEGKMHTQVRELITTTDPPYVFMLSGTPVQANPDDLGSLHDLVDTDLLGSMKAFSKEHVRFDGSGGFPKVVAYRNINRLRALTEQHILRRTDQEVEVERPHGEPQNIDVELTPLQIKIEEAISDRRSELRQNIDEVTRKAGGNMNLEVTWKGQKQKASDIIEMLDGAMQGTMAARVSMAIDPTWLMDSESKWTQENLVPLVHKAMEGGKKIRAPKMELLLEEVEQRVRVEQEKVVIFLTSLKGARHVFRAMVSLLGRDAVSYFVGGMSDNERQAQIDRFMDDPACYVMVANDAGRAAVNMQVAKYMYHLDLPWNVSSYFQRCGRILRVGSKHKQVHIFNIVATGSIDEDVLQAWERKKAVQQVLVGVTEEQSQALQAAMKTQDVPASA